LKAPLGLPRLAQPRCAANEQGYAPLLVHDRSPPPTTKKARRQCLPGFLLPCCPGGAHSAPHR